MARELSLSARRGPTLLPESTRDMEAAEVTPALEARSLYRFFRSGDEETLALQGVSLVVNPGEIVAVTGPSGSGKSTLLACLAGLDEPSGGQVLVAGQRISHQPESIRAALRARHVGVLYQTSNLLAHLSVASNVLLSQSLAHRQTNDEVGALLETLGIAGRAGAHPGQLSGGEAARAGLAVALANDPAVLLADEPTGELDGETESRLLRLLVDRADNGGAVVIASHSPAVVVIAHRVIHLHDGRIVE